MWSLLSPVVIAHVDSRTRQRMDSPSSDLILLHVRLEETTIRWPTLVVASSPCCCRARQRSPRARWPKVSYRRLSTHSRFREQQLSWAEVSVSRSTQITQKTRRHCSATLTSRRTGEARPAGLRGLYRS